MDSKTIGHKLRALRGEMDAKTVADALGISTSALFMYERGERIPRDQIKKRIAQYFGQSVEEIFFAGIGGKLGNKSLCFGGEFFHRRIKASRFRFGIREAFAGIIKL